MNPALTVGPHFSLLGIDDLRDFVLASASPADLWQRIKDAEAKLKASDLEIKSLLKQKETLKQTLEDFEDASPRKIEI